MFSDKLLPSFAQLSPRTVGELALNGRLLDTSEKDSVILDSEGAVQEVGRQFFSDDGDRPVGIFAVEYRNASAAREAFEKEPQLGRFHVADGYRAVRVAMHDVTPGADRLVAFCAAKSGPPEVGTESCQGWSLRTQYRDVILEILVRKVIEPGAFRNIPEEIPVDIARMLDRHMRDIGFSS